MAVSTESRIKPPVLLELLADGRLQSGEALAEQLAISRAAVWKGVARLRSLGLDVQAVPRRGYRLQRAVELLDAQRIWAQIGDSRLARLRALELLFEVASTNDRLLAAPPPPAGSAEVCLCELQHAGRGRRGRRWIAPFGGSVALSMSWTFNDGARSVPSLSLAVGVAVWRALKRAGAAEMALKWPNDIWFRDRKIGGILIELRAEASGPAHVVIGVGVNVALGDAARAEIEKTGATAAAVADACTAIPSRNVIAGAILDELLRMLAQFEAEGFAAFREAWLSLDALRGREVRVLFDNSEICGTARGVDPDGALLLESGATMHRFVSGEASLRVSEGAV